MGGEASLFEGGAFRGFADSAENLSADAGRVLPGGRGLDRIGQADVVVFQFGPQPQPALGDYSQASPFRIRGLEYLIHNISGQGVSLFPDYPGV